MKYSLHPFLKDKTRRKYVSIIKRRIVFHEVLIKFHKVRYVAIYYFHDKCRTVAAALFQINKHLKTVASLIETQADSYYTIVPFYLCLVSIDRHSNS